MPERKINLGEFIDDLPLVAAQYKNKIKAMMITFAIELLELAAENAEIHEELFIVDKQSILNTINQVE